MIRLITRKYYECIFIFFICMFICLCEIKGDCKDTDNGVYDRTGDNCLSWYKDFPESCGDYDDEDFTANTMCCACGSGGTKGRTIF